MKLADIEAILRAFKRRRCPVAVRIVGTDRRKENSSEAGRDMLAICPAAIVHIDREVPGKRLAATSLLSAECISGEASCGATLKSARRAGDS